MRLIAHTELPTEDLVALHKALDQAETAQRVHQEATLLARWTRTAYDRIRRHHRSCLARGSQPVNSSPTSPSP